ncbi:Sensor histidine kinase RcsC [Eubacterium plexicaudatum ASF492]|nr:Sensor histidine kinase RcsC [Eubacterium plexicaudatum ASF492]
MSPQVPEYLIGDELRVGQILNNLLSNALKFTSVGKITVEVVRTARVNDKIELFFIVKDTGIGIDQADKEKLFQSFSQADASISRKYGGTGLGLNICKQLVELMGGRIEVEGEKGRGSTFSFLSGWESAKKMNCPYREKNRPIRRIHMSRSKKMRMLLITLRNLEHRKI